MKKTLTLITSIIITLMAFSTITYTSCKKDKCKDVACLNGGACSDGKCVCNSDYTGTHCETKVIVNTDIVYKNNTFTPITITINGVTKTIPVGGTVSYTGLAGSIATGTAITSGKDINGNMLGLAASWGTLTNTFPASGTYTEPMNIGASLFFVRIQNSSAENITDVYSNYGLAAETHENIGIPNDGVTYNVGYYSAYSNSNMRLESALHYWAFNSLNLTGGTNQYVTLQLQ